MTQKQRLIIIGNGMAGARLLEEVLARQGYERYEIVVFGDEPYGNYNRILLSSVLAGSHDPRDIFINPLSWYEENNIVLHAGDRVHTIDHPSKLVYAASGRILPYDKLVIATGSSPYIPALKNISDGQGSYKAGIFAFRTMDDCDSMIKYSADAKRAIVIGGGLLGLEAARGLLNRGLEVHVVHVSKSLMNVQLDMSASKMLRSALEHMGVHLHLEKRSAGILGDECVQGVVFEDGSTLASDMVVISTGIRPNTDLARQAGLAVERGIIVQDDMACSVPDVYAIGECTQHRDRTYGLVAPIWEQAQCLADRLTDEQSQAIYEGTRDSTKLKVMGVELAVMGEKEAIDEDDEVVVYSEPARGIYKKPSCVIIVL